MDNPRYRKPVGGYFELERSTQTLPFHPRAIHVQSARAALALLLQQAKPPQRIWLPYYRCNALLQPILTAGIEVAFYTIDATLNVREEITLGPNEWLLYINYFGLCDHHTHTLLERYPPAQIIIDNAQAFYAQPQTCLATLYSPRKFFGLPDGGLLVSMLNILPPKKRDTDSLMRSTHLLKRLAGSPEEGYQDFLAAEASLEDPTPQHMSHLTEALLSSVDTATPQQQRRTNFAVLQTRLAHLNRFTFEPEPSAVPLCYPLWLENRRLHEALIRERFFIPTYWPEVMQNAPVNSIESALVETCHPLPCDQRYTPDDMNQMADILLKMR